MDPGPASGRPAGAAAQSLGSAGEQAQSLGALGGGEREGRVPPGPPERPAVEGPSRVGRTKAEPHLCSQPSPRHGARPSPQLFTADFLMRPPEGARIPSVPTHCPARRHPVRLQ